jgi:2-polyprenyl-3-methyl-5-hydroxy-6-metoxy-1,4-benzoquinol methylase
MKIENTLYDDANCSMKTESSEIPNKFLEWLPRKGRLLNVGCGPFTEAERMLQMGLDVYGCDISRFAIKKICDHKIRLCDARVRIPFKNNYFDIVYCTEVIEHLGQVGRFFDEITRVTKRDGMLLLSTPLFNYWKFRLKIMLGKDIFDDYHCRYFTKESIKSKLEKCGFEIVDYEVAGRFKHIKKSLCGHIFLKAIRCDRK